MFTREDRELFEGHDPIPLYKAIVTAFDGDPGPLLTMAASKDEGSRNYARAEIQTKLSGVCSEKLFLDFMKWVDQITEDYRPFVESGAILYLHEAHYLDICGYWFNRNLLPHRQLWATYQAGKRLRDGTLPPPEMFEAVASCEAEAQEMMYDAQADAHDRAATRRSSSL